MTVKPVPVLKLSVSAAKIVDNLPVIAAGRSIWEISG